MTLYDKDEAAELTPKEKGMLKEATLRGVESSMAKGGTRDRVNATAYCPASDAANIAPQKSPQKST
jgi:hypothetical protein